MFVPFHLSSLSTSTVAESYKQLNKTIGNKTVLEEGYYYLNNFNHILSSFGEDSFFSKQHFVIFLCGQSTSSFFISVGVTLSKTSSAVTLFELTVVNNWYITMVRSKHLRSVDCTQFWRYICSVGGAVNLLLCLFPDRKGLLLWQVTGAGCISWLSISLPWWGLCSLAIVCLWICCEIIFWTSALMLVKATVHFTDFVTVHSPGGDDHYCGVHSGRLRVPHEL